MVWLVAARRIWGAFSLCSITGLYGRVDPLPIFICKLRWGFLPVKAGLTSTEEKNNPAWSRVIFLRLKNAAVIHMADMETRNKKE